MPRRYQGKLRNIPIVSNKEIIDGVALIVAGGVITDFKIADAVLNYAGTVGTVQSNGQVKGFYIETSYANVDNIVGRLDWYLCKKASDISINDFPSPGATGGTTLRRLIFHEEKGIFTNGNGTTAGGQMKTNTQFIAIPKRFQKMSEGDEWFIRIGASENYSFCLKCIYKWFI